MNEYSISNYSIFNDAVQTTNDCNSKINNAQSSINECKSIISDQGIFMGPIQEKCVSALTTLDTDCSAITTNLESISNYLVNTNSSYQAADQNAQNQITGSTASSEVQAMMVQNTSTSNQVTGSGNFTKYQLSEHQLTQITAIALHEQGTAKGAAAEASLMANRFELYGSKYGTGGDGLVNYIRTCKWFANAENHMNDSKIVTPQAYSAVKSVLVDGKRTLPKYIDEHDYLGDLTSVTTNGTSIGVKDRESYKQHNTVIKNKYGATYKFYSFPDSKSDPFGYTSEKKRQQYGDECYAYEELV